MPWPDALLEAFLMAMLEVVRINRLHSRRAMYMPGVANFLIARIVGHANERLEKRVAETFTLCL